MHMGAELNFRETTSFRRFSSCVHRSAAGRVASMLGEKDISLSVLEPTIIMKKDITCLNSANQIFI
jgi:hypothetical protein